MGKANFASLGIQLVRGSFGVKRNLFEQAQANQLSERRNLAACPGFDFANQLGQRIDFKYRWLCVLPNCGSRAIVLQVGSNSCGSDFIGRIFSATALLRMDVAGSDKVV